MLRRSKATWIDARGNERDIEDLETDHVVNIIALLERRRAALEALRERANIGHTVLRNHLSRLDEEIGIFLVELERRS